MAIVGHQIATFTNPSGADERHSCYGLMWTAALLTPHSGISTPILLVHNK